MTGWPNREFGFCKKKKKNGRCWFSPCVEATQRPIVANTCWSGRKIPFLSSAALIWRRWYTGQRMSTIHAIVGPVRFGFPTQAANRVVCRWRPFSFFFGVALPSIVCALNVFWVLAELSSVDFEDLPTVPPYIYISSYFLKTSNWWPAKFVLFIKLTCCSG